MTLVKTAVYTPIATTLQSDNSRSIGGLPATSQNIATVPHTAFWRRKIGK